MGEESRFMAWTNQVNVVALKPNVTMWQGIGGERRPDEAFRLSFTRARTSLEIPLAKFIIATKHQDQGSASTRRDMSWL